MPGLSVRSDGSRQLAQGAGGLLDSDQYSGQDDQVVGKFIPLVGSRNLLPEMLATGLDAIEETLTGVALAHLAGEGLDDIFPDRVVDPRGYTLVHQDFHIALRLRYENQH